METVNNLSLCSVTRNPGPSQLAISFFASLNEQCLRNPNSVGIESIKGHSPQVPELLPQPIATQEDPNLIKIKMLESEIVRLQDLCREQYTKIDILRKEKTKLIEAHSELRDTTMDLAYSLADSSLWLNSDQKSAFKTLTKYAKTMQYLLQLPVFVDPIEQLVTIGMDPIKAESYLETQYLKKRNRKSKIQRGDSQPTILYKCKRCRKKPFLKIENSARHAKIHKSRKFKCIHCHQDFQSFDTYKSHYKICYYDLNLKTENGNWHVENEKSCSNSSSSSNNNNNWNSFYGDKNNFTNLIDFTHVLWPENLSEKFPDINVLTYVANG